MKQFYFLLTIFLVAANMLVTAQQQPTRKVLFTLNRNEVLDYNEYWVESSFTSDKYACIVADTVTGIRSFVFNGDRIAKTNVAVCNDRYFRVKYLNPNEEKGYVFSYSNPNGTVVINIKGKSLGPFKMEEWDFNYNSPTSYSFMYETIENRQKPYWVNVSGKLFGPFKYCNLDENNDFICEDNEKYYLNHLGKIIGPGPLESYNWFGSEAAFSPDGNQFIKYIGYDRETDCNLISINGTISKFSKDSSFGNFYISNSGNYSFILFSYTDEQDFICINGQNHLASGNVHLLRISESGNNFAYAYEKNEKHYVNVNNKVLGPYDEDIKDILINDNGNFKFYYSNQQDEVFCYNSIGSRSKIIQYSGYPYTENGIFKFILIDGYTQYIVDENGNKTIGEKFYFEHDNEHYDDGLSLETPDKKHTFRSSYKTSDVIIDDKTYVHSAAMRVWYEPKNNSFVWNSLENRELVVYTFKL